MAAQLKAAFPIQTYPHVLIMPDGNVAVSAGSTLVRSGGTGAWGVQGHGMLLLLRTRWGVTG